MPLGKVWPTAITESSTTLTDIAASVGEVRIEDGVRYVLAKSGAALEAYECVTLHTTAYETVGGKTGIIVVKTATDQDDVMGVTVAAVAAADTYFWLAQHGIVTVQSNDKGILLGQAIMPDDAVDGSADVHTTTNTAFGVALADDSATAVVAFINCPAFPML